MLSDDPTGAPALFNRAIALDPNFAMAYATLGTWYANNSERGPSAENEKKAFDLRDRVSERERFYIESHYYQFALGDLEKALESYRLWETTYPRDVTTIAENMSIIYTELGQNERALEEMQKAMQAGANDSLDYVDLTAGYLALNRFDEAKSLIEDRRAHGMDNVIFDQIMFTEAFLRHDRAAEEQELKRAESDPLGDLFAAGDRFGEKQYLGQFQQSHELGDGSWNWLARAAIKSSRPVRKRWGAKRGEAGDVAFARSSGERRHPKLHGARYVGVRRSGAGICGENDRAQAIVNDLEKRFPADTLLQNFWLPTIQAQVELNRGNAAHAVDLLQKVASYDLSEQGGGDGAMAPAWVRGEALLALKKGDDAAKSFRR